MSPCSSCASTADQFSVAMQKKVQNSVEEQGKEAVALIQATAPAKASSGAVGTQLHVVG
jgi:hypothetical protein